MTDEDGIENLKRLAYAFESLATSLGCPAQWSFMVPSKEGQENLGDSWRINQPWLAARLDESHENESPDAYEGPLNFSQSMGADNWDDLSYISLTDKSGAWDACYKRLHLAGLDKVAKIIQERAK